MGTDERELAALRERAYGANADIAGDAAALERLRELEAGRAGVLEGAVTDASAHVPEDHPAAPPAAAADVVPPRSASRRLPWIAWAASLVVVAAVSAAVTAWIMRPPPDDTVRLQAVPEASPALAGHNLYTRGLQQYEDYFGITIASSFVDGKPCLMLWPDLDLDADAYRLQCTGFGLAPTATLAIEASAPVPVAPEAIAEFPEGTSLRFTLVDGAIVVEVGGALP